MAAWKDLPEPSDDEHRYHPLGQEGRRTTPLGWPAALGCVTCLALCCACASTLGNPLVHKRLETPHAKTYQDEPLAKLLAAPAKTVFCNPDTTPAQLCPGGALCPASGICGGGTAPAPTPGKTVFCDPHSTPAQRCPGGALCPTSGVCGGGPAPGAPGGGPAPAPTPAPTIPPPGPCQSPALAWRATESRSANVQAGLQVLKKIDSEGVIASFMAKHPEIKTILWDSSHGLSATVDMMMTYSKKSPLFQQTDLATYMKKRGYVQVPSDRKKNTLWKRGNSYLLSKAATDWKEKNGPNNGFMRVFMQSVLVKLHIYNSEYGWDNGLVAALYDGTELYLIKKLADENWRNEDVEKTTPRHWILPQLHYLGIYANDIANKAQNMGIVVGQPGVAVPIDLDAIWRGSPATGSSFLKTLPPEIRIQKMERNYAHIK